MSDKIKLVLDIVNQNFVKGIEDAERAVADFGKSSTGMKKTVGDNLDKVTKKTQDVTGAWNIFKGAFAANIIAAGFAKLAGAAIEFGKESIEASKIQQEAVNSVANAMKVAGDYSEEALQSHKDFASQLQQNSKIGDETTLSMIALSKSYGLTNDEAQKVTKAAVDLSAATGQSLESAVRNLSGTFNGQIGLLGKMDEGLKSLTKEQLASGAAVDLLAKKYEGTAKGELATFDGALQQAKNAFGDVQEVIGDFVTNSGIVQGVIKSAADAFVGLGNAITNIDTFIEDNIDLIKTFGLTVGIAATALGAYTVAMNISTIATTAYGVAASFAAGAMAILTSPVTLVIAGVVALSAAVAASIVYWDELKMMLTKVGISMADFTIVALEALVPFESGVRTVLGTVIEVWGYTMGTMIQSAIDLGSKFASIFGVELPESMVNFQDNILETAEEIKSGKGAIGSLIEGVEEMRDATQASLDEQEAAYAAHNAKVTADNKNKTTAILTQEKTLQQERANLVKQQEKERVARDKAEKERLDKVEADRKQRIATEKGEMSQYYAWQVQEETTWTEYNKRSVKERAESVRKGIGAMTGFMKSGNQEMFEVGKAAAIAGATIDTYKAANGAYASLASIPIVGPALGIAAAAAAVVAGMAQVKNIKAQKFALGGIVAGSSITGDQVPIQVNSGEMILNKQQQTQLLNVANGSGGSDTGRLEAIEQRIEALITRPIIIEIDGSRVAQVVRDQSELGFGGSFA